MSNALTPAKVKSLGGTLLPENKTHTNRIEIKSETSNRLYVVSMSKTSGEWQCSCPGWVMKKPGRPRGCKHLKVMQPALEAAVKQARLAGK